MRTGWSSWAESATDATPDQLAGLDPAARADRHTAPAAGKVDLNPAGGRARFALAQHRLFGQQPLMDESLVDATNSASHLRCRTHGRGLPWMPAQHFTQLRWAGSTRLMRKSHHPSVSADFRISRQTEEGTLADAIGRRVA